MIRIKEGNQLGRVLSHPVFQSDPLAAIHQHLRSTQPVTDDDKQEKKKKKKKSKKARKRSKRMLNPGPDIQSMEV